MKDNLKSFLKKADYTDQMFFHSAAYIIGLVSIKFSAEEKNKYLALVNHIKSNKFVFEQVMGLGYVKYEIYPEDFLSVEAEVRIPYSHLPEETGKKYDTDVNYMIKFEREIEEKFKSHIKSIIG